MPRRKQRSLVRTSRIKRMTHSDFYNPQLHYFEYGSVDNEGIQKFEQFINNNLSEFFSQAEMLNKKFYLSHANMQSVNNKGGTYRKLFTELANALAMQSQNRRNLDGSEYNMKPYHEQKIFATMLYESNSFEDLIKKIREYLETITKGFYEWNVVYYAYYEDRVIGMSHDMQNRF